MRIENWKSVFRYMNENKKTELSQQKIELGLIQDGQKLTSEITSATKRMSDAQKGIEKSLNELRSFRDDGKVKINRLNDIIDEILLVEMELGIKSNASGVNEMVRAVEQFDSADKKIQNLL